MQAVNASYTIGDIWHKWMAERAGDGLSNDIYMANWKSLAPHFADRTPDNLTRDDCREYARKRFALGRSPSTVHTELARLRSCLKWGQSEGFMQKPAKIWVPQPAKPRDRVLSKHEIDRLLEGARRGDPHVYVFVVLAITTGARHTAILDLTWDRVDWDNRTIAYDTLDRNVKDPMSKKWSKGRAMVPMSDLAYEALWHVYPGRQCDHVIEHGGRRLKSIRTGFAAACERAGLEGVTPHTIRHTFVTLLRQLGIDVAQVAQMVGHTDTRTTELQYTHPNIEFLRPAAHAINSLMSDIQQTVIPTGKTRDT